MAELRTLTGWSDIPRRIVVCREALKLIARDDEPEAWAALHRDVGDSLLVSPGDERVSNLQQAVHHYERALEVYSEDDFPEERGSVQKGLAEARRELSRLL